MKSLGLVLAAFCVSLFATAGNIVLEGSYQDQNLYIINSISDLGVGFCVYEVEVNGKVTSDETNSHAFEVDLAVYGFHLGEQVIINIKYKEGCEPKILNPGAILPQPTFDVVKIDISDSGILKWEAKNEQGGLPYIVQQYKWNKWVNVGEVMGKGVSTVNEYSFQTKATSGQNKFRVVQQGYNGVEKKSPTVEYASSANPASFKYDKKTGSVNFTEETSYELYNEYGQIVKRGNGVVIEVMALPKGTYYLSFDSATQKFEKK